MRRSMISLVTGIVLGLVAVALMFVYIRNNSGIPARAPAIALAPAVVAAKDLPFGTRLEKQFFKVVQWPKASVPDGTFASIDEIFQGATQPGDRIALALIARDEPITRSKISGFGAKPTLSRQVENGKRAMSIRVDDVVGVSGFVLPGDRVDIMLTRRVGTGQNNLLTEILLQNITILGIDQTADQTTDKPIVARTATVEVTPEEAQKLALAQQAGSLSLALRSVETASVVQTRPMTEADLTPGRPVPVRAAPRAAPPAPPKPPTVRVRYGDAAPVDKPVRQ
jgi:pilus assembly protein CpaB